MAERPVWKQNKLNYIKEYTKSHYHRITLQISTEGEDAELWNAIKDAASKNRAIKELAMKGLKK